MSLTFVKCQCGHRMEQREEHTLAGGYRVTFREPDARDPRELLHACPGCRLDLRELYASGALRACA